MEILLYQALIVATLIATRLLSPARLTLVCLIWTGMTLVNLFWPPLIVIQLLVIWGTFSLLKPTRSAAASTVSGLERTVTVAAQVRRLPDSSPLSALPPHGHLPTSTGVGPMPGRVSNAAAVTELDGRVDKRQGESAPRPKEISKAGGGLRKFGAAVQELNDQVAYEREAQKATVNMVADYNVERVRITMAMETAERQMKQEDWLEGEEGLREAFEEEFAQLSALFGETDKGALPIVKCANFTLVPDHAVPGVAAAIERKYASITDEYSVLLQKLVERFRRQPGFRAVFEKELLCSGGARILSRIKCFEADREWRQPPAEVD